MAKEVLDIELSEETGIYFQGSVPQVYEDVLGDFIFGPCAENLVGRIANKQAWQILELAAGTGRATQHLSELCAGSPAKIVATDISLDMLEVAKQLVVSPQISWQQADIADLPFADNRFDVVACQFGMMFLHDKVRGFSEVRRVLKPGGQFLFNVWAPLEENKLWQIANQVMMRSLGQLPSVLQKVGPFSCSHIPTTVQQLQDAGFDDAEVETIKITNSIRSAELAAKGFVHGLPFKEWMLKKSPEKIQSIERELGYELAAQLGNFPLTTTFSASVYSVFK